MTKLTDLEICKRIAEIEGYKLNEFCEQTGFTSCSFIDKSKLQMDHISFNPLIDKALCWDLMIKYDLDFYNANKVYEAWFYKNGMYFSEDINPCRAVCLAIIEKHNDN